MPLPPKRFYTLSEATDRWNCSENDVLAWAMDGLLTLSIFVPHCHVEVSVREEIEPGHFETIPVESRYSSGLLPISAQDAGVLWSYGKVLVEYLANLPDGRQQRIRSFSIPGMESQFDDGIPVRRQDLKMNGEQVREFEERYLIQSTQKTEESASLGKNEVEDESFRGRHGLSKRHRERTRAVAAALWQRDPKMRITEVIRSFDVIQVACEGKRYSEKAYRNWLADLSPNGHRGRPTA